MSGSSGATPTNATNGVYIEGSVVITPAAMYEEITALRVDVQRLTAAVDPTLTDLRADVKGLRSDVESLKNWRAAIAGALALLSALVSYGLLNLHALGG